jgi:hypothetical protein
MWKRDQTHGLLVSVTAVGVARLATSLLCVDKRDQVEGSARSTEDLAETEKTTIGGGLGVAAGDVLGTTLLHGDSGRAARRRWDGGSDGNGRDDGEDGGELHFEVCCVERKTLRLINDIRGR